MPFLALGGVPIPVDLDEVPADVTEIGDQGRADDGTYLSDLDGRVEDVPLRTRWMTPSEYTTVYAAMTAAAPIAATGDLVGSGYDCAIEIKRNVRHSFADGIRRRVEFVMHEIPS